MKAGLLMPPAAIPPANTIAVVAVVLMAGVYDLRFRRIPNWLALTGMISGFVLHTADSGWHGLGQAGLGFVLALGVYVLLFVLHAVGAGDVKLMAAVGSLAGPRNWLWIFLLTALIGGAISLVLAIAAGRLRRTLWNAGFILREMISLRLPYLNREELDVRSRHALTFPHAVAIAAATVLLVAGSLR